METADWVETDSADNAQVVVTKAAASEVTHFVSAVIASYSGSQAGLLVLATGGRTLLEVEVFDELDIEFSVPMRCDLGKNVTLTFDASGGAGNIGYVTLMGYSY